MSDNEFDTNEQIKALNIEWPTNKVFGQWDLNLESSSQPIEEDSAVEEAHLSAFQIPSLIKNEKKGNELVKLYTKSHSSDSDFDPFVKSLDFCECGPARSCHIHLPYLRNSLPEPQPSTSNEAEAPSDFPLDSNAIPMLFNTNMKKVLSAIFGEIEDECDLDQDSEVHIPIWLAQQLFNAWKKLPVMDNPMDIIATQDEALGLQDEEIARLLCKEMNGFEVGYGRPPMMLAQDDMASHLTLALLHEKYDKNFNPNIVDGIYRECGYNYQHAADALQSIIDEQKPKPPKGTDGPYLKIVKSAAPAAIYSSPRCQPDPILPLPTWSSKLRGEELKEHVHSLRQKACRHLNARNDFYIKAQEVYADKNKRAAAYVYAEMAREQHRIANEIQNDLVNNMLYQTKKELSLDLHNLTVERAIQTMKTKLKLIKAEKPYARYLEIITGRGKSNNDQAKIKPAVENWLLQKNIPYKFVNPGAIQIDLRKLPIDL